MTEPAENSSVHTCAEIASVGASNHQDGAVTPHDLAHVACELLMGHQLVCLAAGAYDASRQAARKVVMRSPHKQLQSMPMYDACWQAYLGIQQ